MSDIDPIAFGKLIQSVETLTVNVATLTTEVDSLKQTLAGGRGIAFGLMIACGGMGAAMTKLADHLFK